MDQGCFTVVATLNKTAKKSEFVLLVGRDKCTDCLIRVYWPICTIQQSLVIS